MERERNVFSLMGKKEGRMRAPVSSPEIEDFSKVKHMQSSLDFTLEKICAAGSWDKDAITTMLDNPLYYKDKEMDYEMAQTRRQALREEFTKLINMENCREKSRERRALKHKSLGARKHWLKMS